MLGCAGNCQFHFPLQFHFLHNGLAAAFVAEAQDWWNLCICVTSQTKYPSLRSSGVTAALLTPSLGLGPPPRLEAEWTVLQSREEYDLESRTPEDEEAMVSSDPPGSTTVLMTRKKRKCIF